MSLTDEQRAIRSGGIGGSEIAAISVGSPYATEMTVWRSKMEGYQKKQSGYTTEAGTGFERPVIEQYKALTGRCVEYPGTLVHPEHSIVIATPDGISKPPYPDGSPDVVLEVKCVFETRSHWADATGDDDTDNIPEYYVPQLQWEMGVTGLSAAHMVAYFGRRVPAVYFVPFDQGMFDDLVLIAERFWRDHVLTGKPPAIDGSKCSADYLAARFKKTNGNIKPLDDDALHWVNVLRVASARAAEEQARIDLAKNKIAEWLGDSDGCEGEWGKIRYKKGKPVSYIDYKGLIQHLQPDRATLAEFTRTREGNRPFCPDFEVVE